MTELLQWLTRYSPEVALLVASGAALLFIVRLIVEKSIVPYVDEKVRAVRYQRNFNYAQDILNYDQSQKGLRVWKTLLLTGLIHALKRDKLSKTEKSLGIMAEFACSRAASAADDLLPIRSGVVRLPHECDRAGGS